MKIEVWSVGKAGEDFIEAGIRYYSKRLQPYAQIDFHLLPPPRRTAATQPDQAKKQEEAVILNRLDKHHHLILLDEKGRPADSMQWAKAMERFQDNGAKTLVLLIGGPWGVTEAVRQQAQQVWSLSPLTFPHQLVRLIVAEQLYRSFSILNRSAYHHP